MHTAVMGTDFTRTSLKMRDAVYLGSDKVASFIASIPDTAPLSELVVLSTCNRIEIYFVCTEYEPALAWLKKRFADFHGMPEAMIDNVMFFYKCEDAVRHLFSVAAGCESMVIGEDEILGQIRNAYYACKAVKATDSYLNKLFHNAIAVGKRVRHLTGISRGCASVSSVAIESLTKYIGDLTGKRVLVIGAGVMAMRVVKRLCALGPRNLSITNRTQKRAQAIADQYHLSVLPIEDVSKRVPGFDVVVCATASSEYLLTTSDFEHSEQLVFIVDLGAPRNVDPVVVELSNVKLITIDDLKDDAAATIEKRKAEIIHAQELINEEVVEFTRWYTRKHSLCM